jgi:cathepsin B
VTDVETIKREIINNGPVVTVIPIYRDFLVYKEGVYKVTNVYFKFKRILKNCYPALQLKY